MNWQEFEREMKRQSDGFELPVDTDALWNKIRKKRRRRVLPWLLFALLPLSAALLLWVQRKTHVDQSAYHTELSAPLSEGPSLKITDSKETAAPVEKRASVDKSSTINSSISVDLQNAAAVARNRLITPGEALQRVSRKNLVNKTDHSLGNFSLSESAKGGTEPGVSKEERTVATPEKFRLPFIPRKHFDAPFSRLEKFLPPNPPTVPLASQTTFVSPDKRTKSPLGLGFTFGYLRWQKNGFSPDTLNGLPPQVQPLENLNAGLGMEIPLRGGRWKMETGLVYSQITEQLEWERTWEEWKSRPVLNYFSDGSVTADSGSALYDMHRRVKHYNKWQQIGLPLSMKYAFRANDNWQIVPAIGVQVDWILSAKGILIGEDLNPSAANFSVRYNRSMMLGLRAGVELRRRLDKSWTYFFSPVVSGDLTPRTNSGRERFIQYGLQAGIRYSFER